MRYSRVALAGLGGMVVYFAIGFLLFAVLPLEAEVRQYAALFRPPESMQRVAPVGMASLLVSMLALTTLFGLSWREEPAGRRAVRFGLLVGVFVTGWFMLHNYVSLNIGLRLALLQAVAAFIQWVGAAATIALLYRPARG